MAIYRGCEFTATAGILREGVMHGNYSIIAVSPEANEVFDRKRLHGFHSHTRVETSVPPDADEAYALGMLMARVRAEIDMLLDSD